MRAHVMLKDRYQFIVRTVKALKEHVFLCFLDVRQFFLAFLPIN